MNGVWQSCPQICGYKVGFRKVVRLDAGDSAFLKKSLAKNLSQKYLSKSGNKVGFARLIGFGIICRGDSRIARWIIVVRNGIYLCLKKIAVVFASYPEGSKVARKFAETRWDSVILFGWMRTVGDAGPYDMSRILMEHIAIPRGCTFGYGSFVNDPYDTSRFLQKQGGVP